jgi:hypothetical protein
MVVEATTEEGAQATFTVTAQDNVDGTAPLEEDDEFTIRRAIRFR